MLKLLADENIPKRLVRLLREKGIDVVRIADLGLRGISDQDVISLANRLGRAILTRDSDFTQPWLLWNANYGVVYIAFNPAKEEMAALSTLLSKVLPTIKPKQGLLIIVQRNIVEIFE